MLNADNLTVGYKDRIVLLSLNIAMVAGEITVLVGPNGSGKSTLLRCLAGSLRPVSGTVTAMTSDLYRISARQSARLVAYVAQETHIPFAFTVRELVGLAAGAGGSPDDVEEAISLLDLDILADRALNTLSGGEQQRAAIARGFAQKAPCLLLDEPTAHLDLRFQLALFQALRRRAHTLNCVVVVVLHDLALAVQYADRVVLLSGGVVEASGTVEEVITESLLEKVYNVPVKIHRQGSEIVSVTPIDD